MPSIEDENERIDRIEKANGRAFFASLLSSREPNPKANTMLRDLFGRSGRDKNRADTRAAGAALGVSRDTISRWIRHGVPAHSAAGQALREQWRNSPTGRKRRMEAAQVKKFTKTAPGAVAVSGAITAAIEISNDPRNGKVRDFKFDMDSAEAKAMMQAMLDGDDQEAYAIWADSISGDIFGGSLDVADIQNITWN